MNAFYIRLFTVLSALFVILASPVAIAKKGGIPVRTEQIVISLQEDPLAGDPERACVALQLGTGLLMNGAEVTIFATLGGVAIANQASLSSSRLCERVSSDGNLMEPAPLSAILSMYLDAGGKILACPLCWVVRYGDLVESMDQLIEGDAVYADTPVPLLLEADKVIDY